MDSRHNSKTRTKSETEASIVIRQSSWIWLTGCFLLLLCAPFYFSAFAWAIEPDAYEPDDDAASANVIVLNNQTAQSHNFHRENDADWVKFYGVSGKDYSVKVENPQTKCDAALEIYGPDGTTLVAGPKDHLGPGEEELLEWRCSQSGIYYVKVYPIGLDDYGDDTEYELKVYNPEAPIGGQVSGLITDQNSGLPIQYAYIVSEENYSGLSDEDGFYAIILQSGTFTFTAQAPGYFPAQFTVDIQAGDFETLNIGLMPLASVFPDIKANGQDGPLTVSAGTPFSITITLDVGDYASQKADWWIAAATPSGWMSYIYPSGWANGINLCIQTGLFDIASQIQVHNAAMPAGNYVFYFAVDNNADGEPDADWFDWVIVTVSEP